VKGGLSWCISGLDAYSARGSAARTPDGRLSRQTILRVVPRGNGTANRYRRRRRHRWPSAEAAFSRPRETSLNAFYLRPEGGKRGMKRKSHFSDHLASNQVVGGSNPSGRTKKPFHDQLVGVSTSSRDYQKSSVGKIARCSPKCLNAGETQEFNADQEYLTKNLP